MTALQRVIVEKNQKQDGGQRISVGLGIGKHLALAVDDFGSHVSGLAQNARAGAVFGDVVGIADQHVAGLGIDEEIAVIEVLIAVTVVVQYAERRHDAYTRLGSRSKRREIALARAENLAEFIIPFGAQTHDIAECAPHILRDGVGPEKSLVRRTLGGVGFEIVIKFGRLSQGFGLVPFERFFFAVVIHAVDFALTAFRKELLHLYADAGDRFDHLSRFQHWHFCIFLSHDYTDQLYHAVHKFGVHCVNLQF